MGKKVILPGRVESAEVGGVVAGANTILDEEKGKRQNVINSEVSAELVRLNESKQDNLTFDSAPTEDSPNPVTSAGVYTADKVLSDAIEAILLLIPSAASALNKLVDMQTMNSSIATATASFKGTYNLVSDLHLGVDATHEQIGAALDALSLDADNNDYAFVQVPNSATAPTEVSKTERYKFNGANWLFEYDLNNSGFTQGQWNAINSGVTSLLVGKLSDLPTNAELTTMLAGKQDNLTFDNVPTAGSPNPVKSGGVYARNNEIVALINALDAAKQDVLTFDKAPVEGSPNPVKSGGVYTAISAVQAAIVALDAAKQNVLTFDSTPALGSTNPVTSSGIKTELNRIDGNITTLNDLYEALTQSALVIVQPTDTWPVASPASETIYRVIDRTNTPPRYYSDYMWNGTAMVLMAEYDNAIDDEPTAGSNNLVKSGGVAESYLYQKTIRRSEFINGYYKADWLVGKKFLVRINPENAVFYVDIRDAVNGTVNTILRTYYSYVDLSLLQTVYIGNWDSNDLVLDFIFDKQVIDNLWNSAKIINVKDSLNDANILDYYQVTENGSQSIYIKFWTEHSYRVFPNPDAAYKGIPVTEKDIFQFGDGVRKWNGNLFETFAEQKELSRDEECIFSGLEDYMLRGFINTYQTPVIIPGNLTYLLNGLPVTENEEFVFDGNTANFNQTYPAVLFQKDNSKTVLLSCGTDYSKTPQRLKMPDSGVLYAWCPISPVFIRRYLPVQLGAGTVSEGSRSLMEQVALNIEELKKLSNDTSKYVSLSIPLNKQGYINGGGYIVDTETGWVTDYIPVEQGDVIEYIGGYQWQSTVFSPIWGYDDHLNPVVPIYDGFFKGGVSGLKCVIDNTNIKFIAAWVDPLYKDDFVLKITPKGSAVRDYDVIVAQDGTGDFNNVVDAINYCEKFEPIKHMVIFVKSGEYEMPTSNNDSATWAYNPNNRNLSIIGEDTNSVILFNNKGSYGTFDDVYRDNSCLRLAGNVTIKSLTIRSLSTELDIQGNPTAYCIHVDFDCDSGSVMEIDNCNLYNDHFANIGIGLRPGFVLRIKNCKMYSHSTQEVESWNWNGCVICHELAAEGVQRIEILHNIMECTGQRCISLAPAYNRYIDALLIGNAIFSSTDDPVYIGATVNIDRKTCLNNVEITLQQ